MKALVTGSAGFVGRHMARELAGRGYEVTGVDLVPQETDRHVTAWHADLTTYLRSYWPHKAEVFNLVVHCAYHVGGRAAIDGEPRLLAKNLQLDAALFDWAVETRQQRVLYFSSSAAYPVNLQTGHRWKLAEADIRLDDVEQPDARYGWAKLTGERLAAAATESGLPVHVVRPFSGYAEDQSLDYPFPSIVARARAGDLSVWGPPGQTRDWIHIDDVVAGALAVVDADERRPVNLCTGVGTEMGELALMVAEMAGVDHSDEPQYQPDKPTGVMYRLGDPARMNEHYTAKVSLGEGIDRALAAA
jgi:nucleoside-diphosphate-sugar epimerase